MVFGCFREFLSLPGDITGRLASGASRRRTIFFDRGREVFYPPGDITGRLASEARRRRTKCFDRGRERIYLPGDIPGGGASGTSRGRSKFFGHVWEMQAPRRGIRNRTMCPEKKA
jgi:hypothetical protein